MRQRHHPLTGWSVVALCVGALSCLTACSAGSSASASAASATPAPAPAATLTACSDINDVMSLLTDVGRQLAADKAAGTSTGVQQADYDRLTQQSATRMAELSELPSDPVEVQEVASLFGKAFAFGLENPASREPFDAADRLFTEACGYALFE